jgi:hypothetical protein
MIPNKNTLKNIAYMCSGQRRKPQFGYKSDHFKFTYTKSRCNIKVIANGQRGKMLQGERNEHGEAVFLPWEEDHILSIRLEPPSQYGRGVQFFYTNNMHGCKFFVDTIRNSKDVIVYHANAKKEDPGGLGREANSQLPACVNRLAEMHRSARNEYGNIGLKNIIAFGKQDYFKGANPLVNLRKVRKLPIGIRKREVTWNGRSFICGYPSGDKWKFYYQTFGDVTYERPTPKGHKLIGLITGHWNYLHKLKTEGKTGTDRPFGVIASGEIPLL